MNVLKDQDVSYYIKRLMFGVGVFIVIGIVLIFMFYDNHEIKLKKDTVKYGDEIHIVDLIDAIGTTEVHDSMKISENTIKTDEYEVSFENLDSFKLGSQKLKVRFSLEEIEDETITIFVVDDVKPTINVLKKEPVEMSLESVKNKEFEKLFSISDNATHEEKLKLHMELKEKKFSYNSVVHLVVKVTDSSNNFESKTIEIHIKEKEKPKREETKDETTQQSASSSHSSPPVQPQAPPVQQPVAPKPANKQFLFSQGYDMNTAPSACQAELISSGRAGACTPLQDAEGIYYGMQLTFY